MLFAIFRSSFVQCGLHARPFYRPFGCRPFSCASIAVNSSDGKLVWRGSESDTLSERQQTPAKREEQINRLVGKILGSFPPY